MKINFIVPGLFKSGGMRIIFEYANRFTDKGHDVKLYYPLIGYDLFKGKSNMKTKLKNYYWSFKYLKSRNKLLRNSYKRKFEIKSVPVISSLTVRNADFTIATSWPTAYSVYNLNIKKGAKIYFIQDYEIWNSNVSRVDRSYQLNMHRITNSNYLKNLIKMKFDSDSKVIPNGVNFEVFKNESKVFSKLSRISFIDYDLSKKNSELAIRTSQKLKNAFPDLQFTCFGYDMFHALPDFISFIKNPSDEKIKEIYSNSDVYLFTSDVEGFGLPPLEAMACKCAVISTKVGIIPDYSIHNHSILLIEPNDEHGLFMAVSDLLHNPDKLKTISLNGYEAVRKYFDWDKSVNEFEDFMMKL